MATQMMDAPTEWDEIAAAEYAEWSEQLEQAERLIDDINAEIQEICNEQE